MTPSKNMSIKKIPQGFGLEGFFGVTRDPMGHLGEEIVWLPIYLQMAILMGYFALTKGLFCPN